MSDKEPEIKTNIRFPTSVHTGLCDLAALTGNSQNDIVVQAMRLLLALAASEPDCRTPGVVIAARALAANARHPLRVIIPPSAPGDARYSALADHESRVAEMPSQLANEPKKAQRKNS